MGFTRIRCFIIALNLFIALFICFKFIYCFHYCFKFILLLSIIALNLFIAFRYTLNTFIAFIYIYYVFVNIIPFSRVIWVWKSLAVLADYVSPLRGINNHVNPQGIGSMSTPPWLDSVILLFTMLWILFISPSFSLVICVWKSRLVVVDYVRPQWGINNHVIP